MNATIIFGTKKLGKEEIVSKEKYPELAVITVEGKKEAGKSRRVLLNTKAAELLNCEVGATQQLVFASVEMSDSSNNQVLIANADTMDPADAMITYKTSKNKVSYDDSNEKGKGITSSHACNEIFSFLGKDDSANIEFQLVTFPSQELEAFSLNDVDEDFNQIETITETIADNMSEQLKSEIVIEDNNGELTGEQLQESITNEISAAEEANPVLQRQEPAVSDWSE